MFFDNGGWIAFGEIACTTMFGLSVVLAPFVVKQLDLPETLIRQKALLTLAWDTLWFYLMMVMFAIDNPSDIQDLFLPGTFFVALGWVSVSVMTKAGETPLDLRGWILAITLGLAAVLFVIGLFRQKGQPKRTQA